MTTEQGGGSPDTDVMRAARRNIRYHLAYIGWLAGPARLARRRPADLCGSGGGRPSVGRGLSRRRAMERERTRQKLVRADEIAALVSSDPGGRIGRAAAVAALRRSGFLTDALLPRLREAAREHGFDALGVASPDDIPAGARTLRGDDRRAVARRHGLARRDRRAPREPEPALAGRAFGHHARDQLRPRRAIRCRCSPNAARGAISVYAQGDDYHEVIKPRLKSLARLLIAQAGGDVKVFVDTAAVMEKPLAQRAGLGWQGKHTNLVSREFGSWLFLGAIFTTLELPAAEAGDRSLRLLPRLPRYLSDRGIPASLQARSEPLHFLSHHRAQGTDPARTACGDGQPHLWLRRLSCGLSVEQVRAAGPRGEAACARNPAGAGACRSRQPWTTRNSARCFANRRSSAPAATASSAMC